jgi:hypothetical protein
MDTYHPEAPGGLEQGILVRTGWDLPERNLGIEIPEKTHRNISK